MKKFLCIFIDLATRKDVKEYTISAYDKWAAEADAKALYRVASHYTPKLPDIESTILDAVEI